MMEPLLERTLVVQAQEGDEGAFEQLIHLSLSKVRTLLVTKYNLQEADLDDILQVATTKVFQKIRVFRNESSFTTWFYIVLRNEALDHFRRRNHINSHEVALYSRGEQDVEESLTPPEETWEETAFSILEKKETMAAYRQMIIQILDELNPLHREVIELSLEQEKTYKQIAQDLGVPIGTVMSRLFFARKKAQQLIKNYAKLNAIQLDCLG